jgi:hypothetical protein
MNAPAVIKLPLSTYENMIMELAWRHEDLINQVQKIRTDLSFIKAALNPEEPPQPTSDFDPLRTIGKYC